MQEKERNRKQETFCLPYIIFFFVLLSSLVFYVICKNYTKAIFVCNRIAASWTKRKGRKQGEGERKRELKSSNGEKSNDKQHNINIGLGHIISVLKKICFMLLASLCCCYIIIPFLLFDIENNKTKLFRSCSCKYKIIKRTANALVHCAVYKTHICVTFLQVINFRISFILLLLLLLETSFINIT